MKLEKNTETIEALAELLKKFDLERLSIESDELSVELCAKREHQPPFPPMPHPMQGMPPFPSESEDGSTAVPHSLLPENPQPIRCAEVPKALSKVITTPIVGTFYSASAPGAKPFVKVGDSVKKGDTVCIVESMKLMNELTSDYEGVVAEIFAKDGDPLEFDQMVMRLE